MKSNEKRGFLLNFVKIVLYIVLFGYAILITTIFFEYFEPYLFPLHLFMSKIEKIDDDIYMGPYPHFENLSELKRKYGVSIIISVLNTKIIIEKSIFEKEKKYAEEMGFELYNLPFEYLNIDGKNNRDKLNDLFEIIKKARENHKKIYIHCYLGKHRTGYIKNKLKENGFITQETSKHL